MTWHAEFDGKTAFIRGPKSDARRRLAAAGDRGPVWVKRRQAWATSLAAARGLLDQLDARHIAYTVNDTAQLGLSIAIDDVLDFTEPAVAEKPTEPWRLRYGRREAALW